MFNSKKSLTLALVIALGGVQAHAFNASAAMGALNAFNAAVGATGAILGAAGVGGKGFDIAMGSLAGIGAIGDAYFSAVGDITAAPRKMETESATKTIALEGFDFYLPSLNTYKKVNLGNGNHLIVQINEITPDLRDAISGMKMQIRADHDSSDFDRDGFINLTVEPKDARYTITFYKQFGRQLRELGMIATVAMPRGKMSGLVAPNGKVIIPVKIGGEEQSLPLPSDLTARQWAQG